MSLDSIEREELRQLRAKDERAKAERLVRSAAKDFYDPEDAVAALFRSGDLDYIETAAEAQAHVARLAQAKPRYVRAGQASTPQGSLTPKGRNPQGEPILTGEQLHALDDNQLLGLKESDPALYWRSVEWWR